MSIDPTHHGLAQLLAQIDKLPAELQLELHQVLSEKISGPEKAATTKGSLRAGWAKDYNIVISEDFDEPLEDFKEYME